MIIKHLIHFDNYSVLINGEDYYKEERDLIIDSYNRVITNELNEYAEIAVEDWPLLSELVEDALPLIDTAYLNSTLGVNNDSINNGIISQFWMTRSVLLEKLDRVFLLLEDGIYDLKSISLEKHPKYNCAFIKLALD